MHMTNSDNNGSLTTLMTYREVADYADVTVRTVHRMVAKGKLPKVSYGGLVKFSRKDVERLWPKERIPYAKSVSNL